MLVHNLIETYVEKKISKAIIKYKNGDFYHGEYSNKKKNGYGKMKYADGMIYEGDFENDKKTGKGKLSYPNGDTYEVICYKDGNIKGTFNFADGSVFKGYFDSQIKTGNGKIIYPNGDIYDGDIVDKKKDGHGIIQYKNEGVYTGMFEDDYKQGFGQIDFSDGSQYEGRFENDQMTGEGKYTDAEGTVLIGRFNNGQLTNDNCEIHYDIHNEEITTVYKGDIKDHKPHGKGTLIINNTYSEEYSEYIGDFVDGKKEGNGKLDCQFGEYIVNGMEYSGYFVYEGEFKNDLPDGNGVEKSSTDDIYTGGFKEGVYSGYGEIKYENGGFYKGEFKNGEFDGNGVHKFENTYDYSPLNSDSEEEEFLIYAGTFMDNKFYGQGILMSEDNQNVYMEGLWMYGKLLSGETRYPNGDIYVGTFDQFGRMDGVGVKISNDNEIYHGWWKHNVPDGYGIKVYNNKNVYEGNFLNSKRHGKGKWYYWDGTIYTGTLENGLKSDWGMLTVPSRNEKHLHYWKNKCLWGSHHLKIDIENPEEIENLEIQNIDDLTDDEKEIIICPISHDIAITPIITTCGHKFCYTNLVIHIKNTYKMECPLCRQDMKYIENLDAQKVYEKCDFVINGRKVDFEEWKKIKAFIEQVKKQ